MRIQTTGRGSATRLRGFWTGELIGQRHSVVRQLDRAQYIIEENINIYPDTLVWISTRPMLQRAVHRDVLLAPCV